MGSQEATGGAQGQGGQLIGQPSQRGMTYELVKCMVARFDNKMLCAVLLTSSISSCRLSFMYM